MMLKRFIPFSKNDKIIFIVKSFGCVNKANSTHFVFVHGNGNTICIVIKQKNFFTETHSYDGEKNNERRNIQARCDTQGKLFN